LESNVDPDRGEEKEMIRSVIGRTILLLGVVALFLACLPAGATTVVQSDILQVLHNGIVTCSIAAFEPEIPSHVYSITPGDCGFTGSTWLNVAGQFGHYTRLQESEEFKSDVFGIANIGTSQSPIYVLGFTSDSESTQASSASFTKPDCDECTHQFSETGNFFDATFYLTTTLQGQGWTARFQSADTNVETNSAVPEPTSVGVMFGLATLGLAAWKRRRTA
jgi:hypothetical protein